MKWLLPILIIIVLMAILFNNKIMESWQDYTQYPYGYIFSGKDPLYFYRKDRYRRPYRDGYRFYQSYPIPHFTYYP